MSQLPIAQLPEFITFTGVDAQTDPVELAQLSHKYPIEWGVLFSSSKRRKLPAFPVGRYADPMVMSRIVIEARNAYECITADNIHQDSVYFTNGMMRTHCMFAAHLCGEEADAFLIHEYSGLEILLESQFNRVQINTKRAIDAYAISEWASGFEVTPIVQCRGEFPTDPISTNIQWLFDQSGGNGVLPGQWPTAPSIHELSGYAGGLNAATVVDALVAINVNNRGPYWIDMESGVRDENDNFSIEKCREICELVYGPVP